MNCPNCGAPMQLAADEDYYRCEYCRAVYAPDDDQDGVRVFGESSEFACPVCALPLADAALAHRRMLYCRRCHGMLVPMGEFVELVEQLRSRRQGPGALQTPADPRDLDRSLQCPKCRQRMDTHFYEGPGNVVIDSCSRCYLDWLDCGELFRISRSPDRDYSDPYETPLV